MVENMQGTVILFPDFECLKDEVKKLRSELLALLIQKDELLFLEGFRLEGEYSSLSGSDFQKLKKGYRQIVKVLHPDLHPNLKIGQIELFRHAEIAYRQGDVVTLCLIAEMVSFFAKIMAVEEGDRSYLMNEKKRLQKCIAEIQKGLANLKKEISLRPEKMMSGCR